MSDDTFRRYYAAKAMQGILSNEKFYYLSTQKTAEMAIQHADALIKELAKRNNKKDEDTVRVVRR